MHRLFIALVAIGWAASATANTLSGHVTDELGANVYPLDIDVYVSSTSQLVPTPDDTTNAAGNYSIVLSPGFYDVGFKPYAGSHLFRKSFLGVDMTADRMLDVILSHGQYLSGRITDGLGQGVYFADIDFADPTTGAVPAIVQDDRTDQNGAFTAIVSAGTWNVSVIALTQDRLVPKLFPAVPLTSDQALGTVALQAGHLVQGTVTDDGFFPIADADLDVRPAGQRGKLFTPGDNTSETGAYQLMLPTGTFDISAGPPVGQPYANATARSIMVGGDTNVPNLVLPPGVELRVRCQDPDGAPITSVDLDADSLPSMRRLETDGDASNAMGDIRTLVSTWDFRVTLSPPVATKLLPVRFDSIHITGAQDLGTVTFPRGHWVSGTVVEAGTATPIPGANLDLVRLSNGQPAITPGDVSDVNGSFLIVTDGALYRLTVVPPGTQWISLVIEPFGSQNDTTVTLTLDPNPVGVPEPSRLEPLSLASPWPNPSRGPLSLSFAAGRRTVELDVWDLSGRRVATLFHGTVNGTRTVCWDARAGGRPLPAGLYLVRLSDGAASLTRRVALMPGP